MAGLQSQRIAFVVFPGFQILDLAAMTVFEMVNLELAGRITRPSWSQVAAAWWLRRPG